MVIRVGDNGIGIAKGALGKLFEPFQTAKGPKAIGMGLAHVSGNCEKPLGRNICRRVLRGRALSLP